MKKWIFFLVFLMSLGLCGACGHPGNETTGQWSIAEESNREFTDLLQLRITELDLTENRVTYEIDNSSKDTYCCGTGADFALEVLQNGVWHKMRGDSSWAITLESYTLNPGGSKTFSASLRATLPAGTYRLVKELSLEESPQDTAFICCEFVIE